MTLLSWTTLLLTATILCADREYSVGFLVSEDALDSSVLERLVPYAVEKFNNQSRHVQMKIHMQTYNPESLYGLVEVTCFRKVVITCYYQIYGVITF